MRCFFNRFSNQNYLFLSTVIFTTIDFSSIIIFYAGERWEPAPKTQINKNKKLWARDAAKALDKAKKEQTKDAEDAAKRQKNLEDAKDLGGGLS